MIPCYKFPLPAILREICEKQATANQYAKMGHMKIEGTVEIP